MDLKEKIGPFPKWAILAIAVVAFLVIGYFLFKDMFAPADGQAVQGQNAYPTVPDAVDSPVDNSATTAYENQLKGNSVESTWMSLAGDASSVGGSSSDNLHGYVGDLDPNIYSEVEIHLIRNGT